MQKFCYGAWLELKQDSCQMWHQIQWRWLGIKVWIQAHSNSPHTHTQTYHRLSVCGSVVTSQMFVWVFQVFCVFCSYTLSLKSKMRRRLYVCERRWRFHQSTNVTWTLFLIPKGWKWMLQFFDILSWCSLLKGGIRISSYSDSLSVTAIWIST